MLTESCAQWLHTATNKRPDHAASDLSAAADAVYTHLNNVPELMGSDTGKPAFDEFNKETDADFQSDMNSLWDLPEPDYREIKRLKYETD